MTTPQDNSNITDKDVLEAKTKLANAVKQREDLITEINVAKAWLKSNPSSTIFNLASDAQAIYNGLYYTYQNPLVLDMVAPEGSKTPENAPYQITFTASEKSSYNGFYGLGPTVSSVWVMNWRSKYGTYWNASQASFNADLYRALYTDEPAATRRQYASLMFLLNDKQVTWWKHQEIVNQKSYSLLFTDKKIAEYQNVIDNGPEVNLTDSDGTLSQRAFIDLIYNVGSVNEAYLSTKPAFLNELTKVSANNTPTAVTNASQLWVSGFTNKGMIQPYTKLAQQNDNFPTEVTLPSTDASTSFKTKKFNPTGFQFLYNPASVDMQYSGMLGVDPNMETNGLDQFNPLGVYTQATISFNILINRMFDFRYYNPSTGLIDEKHKGKNLYYPRQPETPEQRDIYKKGTMYDIEHLLRAVLGFGMPSYLGRNMSDGQTADLGFITGIPVELHLGSNLRYLGNVTDLRVSHVLFDERMVPIFTNLSISFARLVDPIDSSATVGSQGVLDPNTGKIRRGGVQAKDKNGKPIPNVYSGAWPTNYGKGKS